MPLKLTYGQLRDPNFGQALRKVVSHAGYKTPSIAINIAKINKRFREEAEVADEQFLKLLKQFAELDEKGEIKPVDPEHLGTYSIKKDKVTEWEAAIKDFNAFSFEVQGSAFRVDDVMPAGLSPLDLMFLDDLLAPMLEAVPSS